MLTPIDAPQLSRKQFKSSTFSVSEKGQETSTEQTCLWDCWCFLFLVKLATEPMHRKPHVCHIWEQGEEFSKFLRDFSAFSSPPPSSWTEPCGGEPEQGLEVRGAPQKSEDPPAEQLVCCKRWRWDCGNGLFPEVCCCWCWWKESALRKGSAWTFSP